MSERLLPNERLVFGNRPRGCLECGAFTHFEWYGIAFCSLDCLDSFATEWGREIAEGADERTEYEQMIDAAPCVPSWWPDYVYEWLQEAKP